MNALWWLLTIVLMAVGLLGTILPIFPGTIVIFAAALLHRLMLGPEIGASWWILGLLLLLTLLSHAIDFLAGYVGAKRFGATKWGMWGAVIGALAGLFFGFVGVLVGPIIGVFLFEFLRARQLVAASRAGWGTMLGNLAGMFVKVLLAFAMIVLFLMNTASPFDR